MGKIQPYNLITLLNRVSYDIINDKIIEAEYKIQSLIKRISEDETAKMLYGMLYVCHNCKDIKEMTCETSHSLLLAKRAYNGIDMSKYILNRQFDSYMQGIVFLCEQLSWKYRDFYGISEIYGIREIYKNIANINLI
ncbi:Hypothetical protein ORPV_263 [Orpheovirus IHUMI-LCC2]|uniref:Uncharacterized protein n=1 Tax=Orpheovirus IHUMI-LCC2 TaxID=2023057 RepID=A0A2I2L3S8_9VIRU|nr:Hypothetical protein ORPV_263 [Orpheovirus IHUMI-LCC2]SNW62167.1 Hypothetical protein ORPV_263 [Orpheovirus IHUMI-LCC2]